MSVIVDDNDPLVQYNGGWIHHNGKPGEFELTTSASVTPRDTATLTFNGTSITIYGTVAPGQARMNVSIDGAELSPFDAPPVNTTTHDMHLWTSPVFTEAAHTLTLTVDHDTPLNISKTLGTLFLDYFVYKTALPGGKTIFVDDSDSSVIYSPDWQTINDCDTCLEGTRHVSPSAGSWVALNFEGSSISLNGSANDNELSVVIDGIQTRIPTDKNPLLFSSPVPQPTDSQSHTVNITSLKGTSFAIDFFLITPTLPGASTSVAWVGAGETGSSGPVPTTLSSGSTNPQVAGVSSKLPPIAAIVGGAVGGLAILLLLLVALIMWRRRQRRSDSEQPGFEYPEMAAIHPWPVEPAAKRGSISSMTTLTDDGDLRNPKSFGKARPASRYIYYE
ncbi:hypothetical protein B0H19DRAFT_1248898 [Mycena capillaripes]|nr:hypothetical protein B0H19DRAFT_1248898 [Mycena capillaripes]